jgi:hypothetical protein
VNALRHRHLLAAPFVLILLLTLIGGLANSMDARGRVVDDITDKPIAGTRLVHGQRQVTTDEQGQYVFPNVPRTSKLEVRPPSGYQLATVLTTVEEIRLNPLTLTIYAFDEAKTLETGSVPNPQARPLTNDKILGTGDATGQIILAPHPATDEGGSHSRILVCGEGFEPKEVGVEGVLITVGLKAGGTGCPPLPTPTPDPNATPTASPSPTASPAEATPAATPTPSPTGTP